jgi:hypothetical protein
MDDGKLVEYLWAGVMSVGGAGLTFLSFRAIKLLDDLRTDVNDASNEIKEHKLYSANTYAKESSVQDSLHRVHDRIDIGNKSNDENFKELRVDVKSLLTVVSKNIK